MALGSNRHGVFHLVYRASYYLGFAIRKTFEVVTHPYEHISRRRRFSPLTGSASHKHSKIVSNLSNMKNRLQAIERSLIIPEQKRTDSARMDSFSEPLTGDTATEILTEALSNPNPKVRAMALDSIGEYYSEATSVHVLEALHDLDAKVRSAAIAAAKRAGLSSAVFSLILLLDDDDGNVRKQAVAAIASITGEKVDFDPMCEESVRAKNIERLKTWWKDKRFANLTTEVDTILKS